MVLGAFNSIVAVGVLPKELIKRSNSSLNKAGKSCACNNLYQEADLVKQLIEDAVGDATYLDKIAALKDKIKKIKRCEYIEMEYDIAVLRDQGDDSEEARKYRYVSYQLREDAINNILNSYTYMLPDSDAKAA